MKPETMTLEVYRLYGPEKTSVVTVSFRERPHWARERGLTFGSSGQIKNPKAYDVLIGKRKVGEIQRSILSTDRKVGRLRSPGRGRPGWASRRNMPGPLGRTGYGDTFEQALQYVLGGRIRRIA